MDWTERLKENFPFYQKGQVYLFNADSREFLSMIPSKVIDLILTDPPYGLKFASYDDSNDVFFELEDELYRVAKDNCFLVFWWSTKKLLEVSMLKKFEYHHLIIAEFHSTYSKSAVGDRKWAPIFLFRKGKPKIANRHTDVLITGELPIVKGKIRSPDFKPTLTLAQLLFMFAKEDFLILDPFAGYGSLPLVCSIWNRPCIAVEKDSVRFEVAKRILKEGKIPKSIPEMEEEVRKNSGAEVLCSNLPLWESSLLLDEKGNRA